MHLVEVAAVFGGFEGYGGPLQVQVDYPHSLEVSVEVSDLASGVASVVVDEPEVVIFICQ